MSAEPDLNELQPLARVIAEKIHTVPVRHCPGGTDDLVSALTLAVAIYVSRHVLPPGLSAAAVRPEPMSDARAAALLVPLEAKARALGEQRDTEHRAAVLREAAAAIQDVIDRDRARSSARSNDRAALGAARQIVLDLIDGPAPAPAPTDQAALLRTAALLEERADDLWAPGTKANDEMRADAAEMRRLADAAPGPGRAADEAQQHESGPRDWGDLEDMASRERPTARAIVNALSRKAAASAGQWPPANDTQPGAEPTS